MKKKAVCVLFIFLAFVLCSCFEFIPEVSDMSLSLPEESDEVSPMESHEENDGFIGKLGSANEIEGNTIIVSIFANDATTIWNDNDLKHEMLRALGLGAEWVAQKCSKYGAEVNFVYDWSENSDLIYETEFSQDMVRYDGGMYGVQRGYVLDSIDSDALLDKYDGDNIIYMFFFNTAFDNEVNPWTLAYTDGGIVDVEVVDVFCRFDNLIIPPASFAHEILHCFGAKDFYYASEDIPQEFVDYCERTDSMDIMYTVNMGDEIFSEFTELAAYYVGLVDECALVDEWGLAKSEHS